jgi:hypothetical protein
VVRKHNREDAVRAFRRVPGGWEASCGYGVPAPVQAAGRGILVLAVFAGSLCGTMLCWLLRGMHAVSPLNSLLNTPRMPAPGCRRPQGPQGVAVGVNGKGGRLFTCTVDA